MALNRNKQRVGLVYHKIKNTCRFFFLRSHTGGPLYTKMFLPLWSSLIRGSTLNILEAIM